MFMLKEYFSKPPSTSAPGIPDTDNQNEVNKFVMAVITALKTRQLDEEWHRAIESLVDLSEQEKIETKHFDEEWITAIKQAEDQEYFQNVLEITTNQISQCSPWLVTELEWLFNLLSDEYEPMVKLQALKILKDICINHPEKASEHVFTQPGAVQNVLNLLFDPSEFNRNQTIVFLKKFSQIHDEIKKILVFQGMFENLADISRHEVGVVVKDCLKLMKCALNDTTKNLLRDMPSLLDNLTMYLGKLPLETMAFLKLMLRNKNGSYIRSNQGFMSKMFPVLAILAFPVDETKPMAEALDLMHEITFDNDKVQGDLRLVSLTEDGYELLDAILYHSANSQPHLKYLWYLITNNKDLQSAFLSKITTRQAPSSSGIPHFNDYLLANFTSPSTLNLLELLVYGNDVSKELALSLPIDHNSSTLMQKLVFAIKSAIEERTSDVLVGLSRFAAVWIWECTQASDKFLGLACSLLPDFLTFVSPEKSIKSSVLVFLLGVLHCQDTNYDIASIISSQIGYSDFGNHIDFMLNQGDFIMAEKKSMIDHAIYSYALVSIYRKASEKIRMVTLKQFTTAVNLEDDVAEMINAKDQRIKELESINKQIILQSDSYQIKELKKELCKIEERWEELETQNQEQRMTHIKEIRGLKEAFISFQEQIDYLEFENTCFSKENKCLKAKVTCLSEKLNLATMGSPETNSNFSLADVELERDDAICEMEYYKQLYEKEQKRVEELLEIVGRQGEQEIELPET